MTGVVALVPMKAHSERVPNKNVRSFNGRPLFHWVLATLEAADAVDEIVVNTDSERIASEASDEFDVTVLERPEHLRGDHVSMNRIILHDVSAVSGDYFLQTHCTNPLLRPETVDEAVEMFDSDDEADSLFSVTPLQTRLWDAGCTPINHERDELLRTQDLEPVYEENSNIYLFMRESVERRENRIGDHPMMFSMDEDEAVDIDTVGDFEFAQFKHRSLYGTDPSIADVVDGQ
jgi:N-acylneuraminate cytidylyltransferase